MNADWSKQNQILLATFPIYGYSFSIAGYNIKIGLNGEILFAYNIDIQAAISMTVTHRSNINYLLAFQYGTEYVTSFDLNVTRTLSQTNYDVTGTADVYANAGLISTLSLSIPVIGSANVSLNPMITSEAHFSYPPFPAGTNPLVPGSFWSFGDCTPPHLFQGNATLRMYANASANVLGYSIKLSSPIIQPIPLASGCLWPQAASLQSEAFLSFSKSISSIGLTSLQEFGILFCNELGKALGIDAWGIGADVQTTMSASGTNLTLVITPTTIGSSSSLLLNQALLRVSILVFVIFPPKNTPTLNSNQIHSFSFNS